MANDLFNYRYTWIKITFAILGNIIIKEKRMEQKKEKIVFWIGMLFIAVMSVCFWGIGVKYIFLGLFVLCAANGVLNKKPLLDKESTLLFAGMLAYSIGSHMDFGWMIRMTVIPFLFYYYGKAVVVLQEHSICEQRSKVLIIVLSIGLFIGSALNMISWVKFGFENGRAWGEFWTGQRLPATQHVFWDLLIISLTFYATCFWKKGCIINGILLSGSLWSLWFSLFTGSRTLVVVFGLVLVLNVFLYCYLNWKNESKKKKIKNLLLGILITCILIFIAYFLNIGEISDFIENSIWGRNGGVLHNIRFEAQISVLRQLFKYPFGGNQMELAGLNYAHNVWLDMANRAGLLPFILIVMYTILTVCNLMKLIRNQVIGQEIKFILVSVYIALFLYYMVEPALDANLMFWAVWMLICGLIKGNIQNLDDGLSLNGE